MSESFLKKCELGVKRYINRIIFSGNEPVRVDKPIDDKLLGESPKILLLRQDRIGDVLVSTPFFRMLRERFPASQIDLLLSHRNMGAKAAATAFINNIYVYPRQPAGIVKLISRLRKVKYDLVIDILDNASTTSSLIVKSVRSRLSLGFDKENRKIYTHVAPLPEQFAVHIVERIASLMYCFGVRFNTKDLKLEYPLSDKDREFAISQLGPRCREPKMGIIMSGSNPDKFWGTPNIHVLIDGLNMRRPDIDIILFSTKNYYETALNIVKNKMARVATLTDSLHEFAAMLSACEFILTPDTSAVHFAAAFNIPCVVLFSLDPDSKRMPWYPFNSRHEVLVSEGPIDRINAIRVEEKINILLQDYRRPE